MTQIDFYTHVADKHRVACVLTAKALDRGLRVAIYGDGDSTDTMDRLLWTTPPIGFIPHCRPQHRFAGQTPVVLYREPEEPIHDEVLLNLDRDRPPFFSRFQRLIEIVSLDPADREAARERYRFYRDRGYDIRTHDLGKG